ncbi:unnamed protein product, partial [Prorocentrum cordatum]
LARPKCPVSAPRAALAGGVKMPKLANVDPAFVLSTNVESLPARCSSYPSLKPGQVAYLPVWSHDGTDRDRHESAAFQAAVRDMAVTMAMVKGSVRMEKRPNEEMRAMAIIKNLPSRCKETEVLDVISHLGFVSDIAAFKMPIRLGKGMRTLNRGYAFVYFSDEWVCQQFVEAATGHRGFGGRSTGRAISVFCSLHLGGSPCGASPAGPPQEPENELAESSCQSS